MIKGVGRPKGSDEEKLNGRQVTKRVTKALQDNEDMTAKESDFILYFLESSNILQSYLKAYKPKGTKATASRDAYTVFHRPRVQEEIKRLKLLMQVDLNIDVTKYVQFLLKIANADIGDYLNFGNKEVKMMNMFGPVKDDKGQIVMTPKNFVELMNSDEIDTSVIAKVKQGRDGVSIELVDKKWAWEKLHEYFNWQMGANNNTDGNSGLIKAIDKSAETVWNQEDGYDDSAKIVGADTDG